MALQDDLLAGGTATGVCVGVEGAASEVPVGVEWVEPGTCGGLGVIRPGACDGVDVLEPGACDVVEGVEPGVCCGVMRGAGDVLLEGEIFNGYWFPSVSLKHNVSSCKPYCFLLTEQNMLILQFVVLFFYFFTIFTFLRIYKIFFTLFTMFTRCRSEYFYLLLQLSSELLSA